MKLWKMPGEFGFVFARNGNARSIEVSKLTVRKRKWCDGSNGARNPAVSLFVLHDLASGVSQRPGFPGDNNVSILVGTAFGQLTADLFELLQRFKALGLKSARLHFERAGVRA